MEDNKLIAQRREKLAALRETGFNFPNQFRPDALAAELHQRYGEHDAETLEAEAVPVKVAGRMMLKRVMGKASFATIQDRSGRLQLFLQRDVMGEAAYKAFKALDVGDVVGASGEVFRTQKGELSVRVRALELQTKALRPLPEKWAGLTDTEARYRQRYVDLTMNPEVREIFRVRSRIMRHLRDFFDARDFIEVETPMLQAIPGGATARPFVTHYNALDREFYLRVAPELYLKRLVVGGFERVYEINRNFRNEGVSTRHNPEFTMLEFYQAYADYHELMDMTEVLFRELARDIKGSTEFEYQGESVDFGKPFTRMTMVEAVLAHNPELSETDLKDADSLRAYARRLGIDAGGMGPGA
ncbi:MAG: lysine--tRNA ligase, partial [Candidatus Competibacterales bacterium]|nr:lysine--tRNA ligase [Candidatus Competibacterales bacterium]